jgi:hypothetical protein
MGIQVWKGLLCRMGVDVKREACFDLFIADKPNGLPIPNVSSPRTSERNWNTLRANWTSPIFEFTQDALSDNGAILLFYPNNPEL